MKMVDGSLKHKLYTYGNRITTRFINKLDELYIKHSQGPIMFLIKVLVKFISMDPTKARLRYKKTRLAFIMLLFYLIIPPTFISFLYFILEGLKSLYFAISIVLLSCLLPILFINLFIGIKIYESKRGIEREILFFNLIVCIYSGLNRLESGFKVIANELNDILKFISKEIKGWLIYSRIHNEDIDYSASKMIKTAPSEKFSALINQYIEFKYTGGDVNRLFNDKLYQIINEIKATWRYRLNNISSYIEILLIIYGLVPILFSMLSFIFDISVLHKFVYIMAILFISIGLIIYIILDNYQFFIPDLSLYVTPKHVTYILIMELVLVIFLIFTTKINIYAFYSAVPLTVFIPLSIIGYVTKKGVSEEESDLSIFMDSAEEWLRHGYTIEDIINRVDVTNYKYRFRTIILKLKELLNLGFDPREAIKQLPILSGVVYLSFRIIGEIMEVGGGLNEVTKLRTVLDEYIFLKKKSYEASMLPLIVSGFLPIVGLFGISVNSGLISMIATASIYTLGLSPVALRFIIDSSIFLLIMGALISSILVAKMVNGTVRYPQYALVPLISTVIGTLIIPL